MTKRFGMGNKKVIKARDLDGDGKPDYVLHAPQGLGEDLANSGGTRK